MTATDQEVQERSVSTGEVVVTVRGLTKVFKDFWGRPKARAVDDVNFEVKQGEVFGLLGPNGSGKSTTVKMLLGLLHPTRGHIQVFGHSPRHVATKSRIGYLPEESYLYRYLNSEETLDFFGNLFSLSPAERRRRSEQLLEMVGLNQVHARSVGEFSKGMQRRIGLAQALINDPDLIILDEPTAGLDPVGCREVKDLITTLAQRGKTIILSSHLLADVEDVCDRVVIYYGGKIQAMGTLKELLSKPDTIRITTPTLARESMEEVLKIIRRDVTEDRVKVDNPTQNLESYFLDVVRQAQESARETSGAHAGGQVAAYLKGQVETASGFATEKVLERLTRPSESSEPSGDESGVGSKAEAERVAATEGRAKLQSLAKPGGKAKDETVRASPSTSPSDPESSEEKKKPKVDLSKANEKLSGLLGGDENKSQ